MAAWAEKIPPLARPTRGSRAARRKSFLSGHDEDVLQMREFDTGCQFRLGVQFTNAKTFDYANEQARWKNAAHTRGINFLASAQVGLFREKIQIQHWCHSGENALARNNPLLARAFDRAGDFAILVRNQK